MTRSYDYDVVVIGAGIAGMVSAVTANGLGKRVAVIEGRKVGGNCTNFTCIPSKTLVRLSHTSREISRLVSLGLIAGDTTSKLRQKVMAHIRSVVRIAYEKDVPETFEQIGVSILSGSAAFIDRHTIEVNGHAISAAHFIIAAGTRPLIPSLPGIKDVDILTNETLYELDELPRSVIILGGGVDGLEYGSAFGRLGVDTTIIEMGSRTLPGVDRELVKHLLRVLEADGIRLMSGNKVISLKRRQGKVVITFERGDGSTGEVEAERVLVALGRQADLEGLALGKAGVNFTPRGIVADKTLRTSVHNIYACGDIVGPDQLASMAEYQGIIAATNAILPVKQKVDYRNNVYVIFTEPPLAFIGLTEAQAHAKFGHKLQVYKFDYASMRRALIDGSTTGMGKFLCDGRGRLVGAHILGEAAPEVIHEAQVIKALKKPLHKLNLVTHAYPTYAQALVGRSSQLAFLDKTGSNFLVKAALHVYPGLANRLNLARDRLAELPPPQLQSRTAKIDVVLEGDANPLEQFQINAVYIDGGTCVIDLPAELMDHDERPLVAAYSWNGSTDPRNLMLNCSRVRRVNGLGASMLVKFSARAKTKGQNLSAFGVCRDLRQVFKVTELDQAIQVHESETAAFQAACVPAVHSTVKRLRNPGVSLNLSSWAKPISELFVPEMPKAARNLNVHGRRPMGPVHGFGRLCQKIFRLHIRDVTISPQEAIAEFKQNFPGFQPSYNHFYATPEGVQAGEIVLIDSITPGGPVSTGVMVVYADDQSFTFNTPQGHPECGFVSFSGHKNNDGTIVQILGLARASDPLYEAAFRLVGSKLQTRLWTHVLTSLALHLGVTPDITFDEEIVDKSLRWPQLANLYYNAQIRTLIKEPKRWFSRVGDRTGG